MSRPIITLPFRQVTYTPSGVQQVEIIYTGIVKTEFYEELSVPYNVPTELAVFTVPVNQFNGILRIDVSGQNTAVFDILIDGDLKAKTRTSFFNTFANTILFGNGPSDALTLSAGQVLKVVVTNVNDAIAGFETRIQYLET